MHQLKVAYQLESVPAEFVVHTGDVVYPNGQWEGYEPYFFGLYQRVLKRVPWFPCIGNHDDLTEGAAPYLSNFYLPENAPEAPERYYSFDFGNAHFTILESRQAEQHYLADSDQTRWLATDLQAAASARWRFVVVHHPPYNCSHLHYDDLEAGHLRRHWVPLFEQYGVHVVFSGHSHDYERTYPLTGGRPDLPGGVFYVVAGGGGRELQDSIAYEMCPECYLRVAFKAIRYHLLRVEVDGPRLSLTAIDERGEVFDQCHLLQDETHAAKWMWEF